MEDKCEIIDLSTIDEAEMQQLGLEEMPDHLSFSVSRKNFVAVVHPAATGEAEPLDVDDIEQRREEYLEGRAENHWSKEEESSVSKYALRLGEAWRDGEWTYTYRGQWAVGGGRAGHGTCARAGSAADTALALCVQVPPTQSQQYQSTPRASAFMAHVGIPHGHWTHL